MTDKDDTDWLEGADSPDAPASAKGEIVSKAAICRWTGLAPATVDKTFADGAPLIARGTRHSGYQANSAAWFDWFWRQKIFSVTGNPDVQSFEQAKKREKSASARLKELQIATREDELIEVALVVDHNNKVFNEIRSQLISLSSQIPTLSTEQREQLDAAINDMLRDISEKQLEENAFTAPEEEASED